MCLYLFSVPFFFLFFFFNDTATTEIYTLSLHDALPILLRVGATPQVIENLLAQFLTKYRRQIGRHTSELQSRGHLVCRLLLEKKKKKKSPNITISQL